MYKHIVLFTTKMNFYSDMIEISIKPAVLKLGVATLWRVAKCPKKVAKLKKKEWALYAANKTKIEALTWYFYI
jgi:hypothetical protein